MKKFDTPPPPVPKKQTPSSGDAEFAKFQAELAGQETQRLEAVKQEFGPEAIEELAGSFKQLYNSAQQRLLEISQSGADKETKQAAAELLLTTWRQFSNNVAQPRLEEQPLPSDIKRIERAAYHTREGLAKDATTSGTLENQESTK